MTEYVSKEEYEKEVARIEKKVDDWIESKNKQIDTFLKEVQKRIDAKK